MLICLGFIVISTILSFGFKDVYQVKQDTKEKIKIKGVLKGYGQDLKSSFKFILKSKRMKAFVLFQIVFYSVITIVN